MIKLAVILVKPQMGENIGSAARIMANFAHYDLRIVEPRDGWPNRKAEILAAGGLDIIKSAKIYSDIAAALEGLDEIYACSARVRKMHKDHYHLKDHIEEIKARVANNHNVKIGMMFGSERMGLLNDDIIYAKKIVNIAANEQYSVLNLSHAIGLVCYEYFNISAKKEITVKYRKKEASKTEIAYFLEDLKDKLDDTEFFIDKERKIKMFQAISNIFTRNDLSSQELKTMVGIVKALYYFMPSDKVKKTDKS
jgi:tRNA/rRNA methyltransferase